MNASILRAILALCLIVGTAVVANLLSGGAGRPGQRLAAGKGVPVPVEQRQVTMEALRAAERSRRDGAVRRELETRGYLIPATTGVTGANGAFSIHGASAANGRAALAAAILAFEFDYGLPLTALASEALLKSLIFTHGKPSATGQTTPTTPEATALILEVHRALIQLGYATAAEPGATLDDDMRNAIRKFERARGLDVSGRISAPLIESLGPAFDDARIVGQGGGGRRGGAS